MNLNILIRYLKDKYNLNVKLINASKLFLKKLKNISNPEKKRKIIGNLFIKVFEKESKKYKKIKISSSRNSLSRYYREQDLHQEA